MYSGIYSLTLENSLVVWRMFGKFNLICLFGARQRASQLLTVQLELRGTASAEKWHKITSTLTVNDVLGLDILLFFFSDEETGAQKY